jgi:hypothetical protein
MTDQKGALPKTHAFSLDSIVFFRASRVVSDPFRVVRQLPVERTGPQYRIRSEKNGQERVMDEALLMQP